MSSNTNRTIVRMVTLTRTVSLTARCKPKIDDLDDSQSQESGEDDDSNSEKVARGVVHGVFDSIEVWWEERSQ